MKSIVPIIVGVALVAALLITPVSAADNSNEKSILEAIMDWFLWWIPQAPVEGVDPSPQVPETPSATPEPTAEPTPLPTVEIPSSDEGRLDPLIEIPDPVTPTPTPTVTPRVTPTPEPAVIGTVCAVDYRTTPPRGCAPLMVRFTASEEPWIDTYFWEFGDGYIHEERDNFHSYMNPGTYTATLTVSNSTTGMSTSASMEIIVEPPGTVPLPDDEEYDPTPSPTDEPLPPRAPAPAPIPSTIEIDGSAYAVDYDTNPAYGSAPLMVRFTASGSPEIDSYLWEFGDGYIHNEKDNFHTYANPGTYTAVLTGTNSSTGQTALMEFTIIVEPAGVVPYPEDEEYDPSDPEDDEPVPMSPFSPAPCAMLEVSGTAYAVDYDTNPAYGSAPLMVRFTASGSPEIDSYLWEFGDGYIHNEKDNFHTYANPGTYTAILTGTDSSTGQTASMEFTIIVEAEGVVPYPEDEDW